MDCLICNKTLKNKSSYNKHIQSKTHIQKEMKLKKQPIVETVVEKPIVETVVEKPIVETVVEKPIVETVVEKPIVETVIEKPIVETVDQESSHKYKREITYDSVDFVENPDVYIIKNTSEKYRYIYHISDIHIKMWNYHEDYEKIFQKVYKFLSEETYKFTDQEKGLIVITGDTIHDKDTLRSNCLIITQKLFYNLSRIMPTIMIAGNHDTNLTSKYADSLEPCIFNIDNFHYLRDTAVYIFNNISFTVQSIFDNKFILHKNINTKCEYDISLYHGMFKGMFNPLKKFDYKSDAIKLFDGYYCTLLGDVHKQQLIDHNIAYAGSLIQQNFGEDINDHGLLAWDLKEKHIYFYEVKSETGFAKIVIDNNKLKTDISELPPNVYLKVSHKNSSEEFISCIVDSIKKKSNILETNVVLSDKKIIKNDLTEFNFSEKLNNINEQNKIIKEFMIENGENEETIDNIIDYNKLMNKNLIINEDKRFKYWYIKKIKFNNIFCFGEDNYIDFDNIEPNNLIGILGENGFGKSKIVEIIIYTLFNELSDDNKNICNRIIGNTQYTIEMYIYADDELYLLKVYSKTTNNKVERKTDFIKINKNGEHEYIINQKNSSDTKNILTEYIGSYEQFKSSNIILQSYISNKVTSEKGIKLKRLFGEHFNINIFSNLYKYAINNYKNIPSECKHIANLIINEYFSTNKKLKPNNLHKSHYDEIVLKYNNLIKNKTQDKNKLISEINNIESDKNQLLLNIQKYKDQIINIDPNDQENKNVINDLLQKLKKEYNDKLKLYNTISDNLDEEKYNNYKLLLIKCNKQKEDILLNINIENNNYNDNDLLTKKHNLDQYLSDKQKYNKIIEDNIYDQQKLNELIKEHENLLSIVDKDLKKPDNIDLFKNKLNNLKKEYDEISEKINDCNKYITENKEQFEDYCENKDKLISSLNNIPEFDKKLYNNETIEFLEKELINIESKLDENIFEDNEWNELISLGNKGKNIKYNESCKICKKYKNIITKINKQIKKINIEKYGSESYELILKRNKINNNINVYKFNQLTKQIEIVDQFCNKYNNMIKQNDILNNSKKILQSKIEYETDKYNSLVELSKKYETNLKNIEKLNNIVCVITEIKSKKDIYDKYNILLDKLINTINNIESEIIDLEKQKQIYLKNIENNKELTNLTEKINKYQLFISEYEDAKKNTYLLKDDINNIEKNIKENTEIYDKLIDKLKKYDDNKIYEENIEKLNQKHKDTNIEYENTKYKLSLIDQTIGNLNKTLDNIENYFKTYFDLKTKSEIYTKYIEIMSENGIQLYYIRKFFPILEEVCNEIFNIIPKFNMKMKFNITENKTQSITINVIKNGVEISSGSLCGSESSLVELALRLAFIKCSHRINCSMLILDEIFSAFDKDSLDKSSNILKYISSNIPYPIIITHQDTIKGYFNYYCSITQDSDTKISNIQFKYT
jgi:DNA repair exonuclease SbcCD ATPase subunit